MTAQGEDILAYLESTITAREEAARAVGFDTIETGDYLWGAKYLVLRRGDVSKAAPEMDGSLADHIALSDPESVLRRCAADRKLIALHQPMNCNGPSCDCDSCCPTCRWDLTDKPGGGTARWAEANQCICPCPTLRHLAEGYGWTEGER
ncbi:DUF6221 family protein [Streptomyces parvus]|uniref:DUF6221 family protein n=1 Tax=Streptomyces parvus TaxID=66428 RepID=UPI0035D97AD2